MGSPRAPSDGTTIVHRGNGPSPRRQAEHDLANALALTICSLELLLVDAKLSQALHESLEEAFKGALEATRLLNVMRAMPVGGEPNAHSSG